MPPEYACSNVMALVYQIKKIEHDTPRFACHPCTGAMLIFSVFVQVCFVPEGKNYW